MIGGDAGVGAEWIVPEAFPLRTLVPWSNPRWMGEDDISVSKRGAIATTEDRWTPGETEDEVSDTVADGRDDDDFFENRR